MITNKEDFINYMLNQSDYDEMRIQEFADDYFENLLSIEDNMLKFIKWEKPQKI